MVGGTVAGARGGMPAFAAVVCTARLYGKVHLFLDGQLRAAEDAAQSVLRDCAGETVSQDLHASVRSIITIISRPTPKS